MTTTVMGDAGGVGFKATGKVIIEPGWRVLYASEKSADDQQSDDKILPQFTIGESGPHDPSLLKKTTQPPKYYTEGTLLRAMESAGKTVDDDELRDAMKENGIGRPSTRAAIIETLFKRRYIYRERKNIIGIILLHLFELQNRRFNRFRILILKQFILSLALQHRRSVVTEIASVVTPILKQLTQLRCIQKLLQKYIHFEGFILRFAQKCTCIGIIRTRQDASRERFIFSPYFFLMIGVE
jgi:hypothetical protein